MHGMGYVSYDVLQRALQQVGRGGPIINPFPQADYDWLSYPSTESPPHYWERIRHSPIYGPGASGPFAWMSEPGQWPISPSTTEVLNINRDIIWRVPRFEDINWNDPRLRFPESFVPTAASEPIPELPEPATAAPATPAPAPSSPNFNVSTTPAGNGGGWQNYFSSEPLPDPSGDQAAPQVKQAGLFSNLPFSLPVMLGLTVLGFLFLGRPKLPGRAPRRRRR